MGSGSHTDLEVTKCWGETVLDVQTFNAKIDRVTVSTDGSRAHIGLPGCGLPVSQFALATRTPEGVRLSYPGTTPGQVRLPSGERLDLASPHKALWVEADPDNPGLNKLDLPPGAQISLRFGPLGLSLRQVDRPRGVVTSLLDRLETTFPNTLLIVAVFFVALISTIHLRPERVEASDARLARVPDRYVQFILDRPKPDKVPAQVVDYLRSVLSPKANAEPAERLRGREGLASRRNAVRTGRRTAVRGDAEQDQKAVGQTGMVAALASGSAGLPGLGGGLGSDLQSAIGALNGPQPGESGGMGGWGFRNEGPGGGGNGKLIGSADFRTHGKYGGDKDYGSVQRRSRPRPKEREVEIDTGTLNVIGPLSMELIRQVIDQHRHQIRYCYNQALIRAPELTGKLTMRFTIGERGYVAHASVANSNLGSAGLETCITKRIRTWKFPAPRGGGSVMVNYPFLFRAPRR